MAKSLEVDSREQTLRLQGMQMPRLGLGTWRLEGAACQQTVATALEIGYRHIDTAQIYGNEAAVGAAIAGSGIPRDKIFITTKVWRDELRSQQITDSVAGSLDRLRLPWVDLLLVHWPQEAMPLAETMRTFDALRMSGRCRHIGVSNFPIRLMAQARELAPIVCNQVECHLFLKQTPLRSAAAAAGLIITAYTPLARGAVVDEPVVQEIAAAHGATAAQVALAWLLAQPGVAAIPKASSAAHLQENFASLQLHLSQAELQRLAALPDGGRRTDPATAPEWDSSH